MHQSAQEDTNTNTQEGVIIGIPPTLSQLGDLVDILDTFELRENEPLFSDEERDSAIEAICISLYDIVREDPVLFMKYDYKENLEQLIEGIVDGIVENIPREEDHDQEIEDMRYSALQEFFRYVPKRSQSKSNIIFTFHEGYRSHMKEKLAVIEHKDATQPEQRTQEWFEMRHNLLSASTAWKAIDSQCNKNALIVEKCKPIDKDKFKHVNINSPFHWGQKYEPVSQAYYEYTYSTRIREYGCIPHSDYSFLGASPDGVNVDDGSPRYGRMLEIKNIVNREINGIPKKEYWVQMQMQMECCDLEECDFLECKFEEYENEEEFKGDGEFLTSANGFDKGIIVQFYHNERPLYEYPPYQCTKAEFNDWYDNIIETHSDKTWVKNVYWRLEKVSCVLVQRNRLWFEAALPMFRQLWDTIVKERVTGHEHRLPTRRTKKNSQTPLSVTKKPSDKLIIMIDT